MNRHPVFLRGVCLTAALAMALPTITHVGVAHAAMVSTEQVIGQSGATADRGAVLGFLARDDVRRQMRALGLDAGEAAARVAAMSDDEIGRIADRLDTLPAGQSAVGAIIGAAVLIFILLLITDIAGLTKVFPFTRSVNG